MNTPLLNQLVSVLILARHGKAVAADGKPDAERELNELGIRQAKALGLCIQNCGINAVLSSPLKRVMNTVRIATNGSGLSIRPITELTCSDDPRDPLMVMWLELGNVPITRYFAHDLGKHLKDWGRTALSAIIRELQNGGSGQKVLIGGHALLQNALLWAISEDLFYNMRTNWRILEEMARTPLNEGEAFSVEFSGDRVWDTQILQPMAR